MEIIPINFNILGLYDNICSMSAFSARNKDLEFRHHFDENIPEVLFADEGRVREIITNIVNNAIKYTKEGSVDFSLKKLNRDGDRDSGGWLSITVADTGIGIKKENFSNLFGTFQQFDREKNAGIMGTGLGLSITKNLVELMGGEISFESEYGKGSVFTVLLPLVAGDPSKVAQVGTVGRVMAREGVQILVVDDNTINLSVATGFLATHNITADMVTSGLAAIEKVQEKHYDIVFMDHMMPGMDGIEAAQAIRKLDGPWFADMPIIALSANAMAGAREAFLAAGMNGFISKPINAGELNAILLTWLPKDKIASVEETQKPSKYLEKEQKPNANTSCASDTGAADSGNGAVKSGKEAALLKELSGIEGFDTAAGLSHLGDNEPAYIEILRQFCEGFDNSIEKIRQVFAGENWKDYCIELHAIKGVFATIGLDSLSKWALKLELASRGGEYDVCRNETEEFCRAMQSFGDALEKTSLMAAEEAVPKTQVELPLLREKLKALRDACFMGDCDAADALSEELKGMSLDPETDRVLGEINALIRYIDYDAAIEKIDGLL
jgi:CheY-like chemotaxis protein/HPt (histidine-containing phosphotransfer) domain-containing protein